MVYKPPKMVWEKWIGPLDAKDGILHVCNEDIEEVSDGFKKQIIRKKVVPTIVTQMGVIPLGQCVSPSADFNFHIGHSGIEIVERMAEKISNIPGVESLEIYTRYRFRIGIGKAFDEQKVKEDVEFAIYGELLEKPIAIEDIKITRQNDKLTQEIQQQVDTIVELFIEKNHPFWAVYTLPNGKIDYVIGATKKDVADKVSVFAESQNRVGGNLILSWGFDGV